MNTSELKDEIQEIAEQAQQIESLLAVFSMAMDGEQIAGKDISRMGGGAVVDMMKGMIGDVVERLEMLNV